MGIFKEVTQTVKNIFNADDDMFFDEEPEFVEQSKQNTGFKGFSFGKKDNAPKNVNGAAKVPAFDLGNHSFDMVRNGNTSRNTRSNGKIQVYVPKSFEEAFNIIKDVKSGYTAMVNVEVANPQVSQRIVDLISGAIYALDGECKKMGEKQYIFSLSTETIGAYDYLPVNGVPVEQQAAPIGFNFNIGMPQQGMQQPMQQQFSFGQQMEQRQVQQSMQQPFNFGQAASQISQDMKNFYVPPKSQF